MFGKEKDTFYTVYRQYSQKTEANKEKNGLNIHTKLAE